MASDDGDRAGDRQSPMVYDGGLAVGFEAGFVPASWHRHPPLQCPDVRYAGTASGWYRCPACGKKTRLAGDRHPPSEAHQAGERAAEIIWAALSAPFRRHHEEDQDVSEVEWFMRCVACQARDGTDTDADYVVDGMSLCGDCAAPMLKVIGERMNG